MGEMMNKTYSKILNEGKLNEKSGKKPAQKNAEKWQKEEEILNEIFLRGKKGRNFKNLENKLLELQNNQSEFNGGESSQQSSSRSEKNQNQTAYYTYKDYESKNAGKSQT